MSAGLFYKIISAAVKIDMSRASDFKLLDRKAVDAILSLPERIFSSGLCLLGGL